MPKTGGYEEAMRLVINQPPGSAPGDLSPRIIELVYDPGRPVLRIGRHTSNDIVISDPSISRHHSEIQVRPDGLIVRDLGSSNGTFINQQRLKPDAPAFIAVGQELGIGNVVTLLTDSPLKTAPPTAAPAYDPLQDFFDETEPPDFRPVTRPPAPRPVASAYSVPPSRSYEEFDYPVRPAPSPARNTRPKPTSVPNWFIIGILIGVLLLGIGLLGFVAWQNFGNNPTSSNIVALPSNIFASPANSDKALGISLAHPSAWQRREGTNLIGFSPPDADSTVITLEKPPGPTILDPRLSPEAALRQYISNVRANSQNFRVLLDPALTRLKDGTPAYFGRIVFTTTSAPLVTDYTVNVLTFKCGDTLYFASTGAEGKNYTGPTRQDLEAAIANFQC